MVMPSYSQKRSKGGEYEVTAISQTATTTTENKGKWFGKTETFMKNCGLATPIVHTPGSLRETEKLTR